MTHASVFSGIGGPEVAATMLGWENLFHCEINPFGRAVLDYWYPNSKSYEDITKTDFTEWRGRVNVLTGGFPCQPFSYAGQRRGATDDRYLWPYMFRCIDQVRPDWVVAENVAGILTMVEQGEVSPMASQAALFCEGDAVRGFRLRETFTLQRICDDLEGHGYAVQPVLIPACGVGAPHKRDRVFIVGHRIDADTTEQPSERLRPEQPQDSRAQQEQSGRGGGEDGSQRNFADTDRKGLQKRWEHERREMEEEGKAGMDNRTERPCCERPSPHADGDRGREVDEHMEPQLADGAEPFGYGWQRNVADTSGIGAGQQQQTECKERGRPSLSEFGERYGARISEDEGICGQRWSNFPSVSPVHRGNDGLPFPVDSLTLPFSKWRTEALKAYGNAIVPQVMYEIFRAIEQVERQR